MKKFRFKIFTIVMMCCIAFALPLLSGCDIFSRSLSSPNLQNSEDDNILVWAAVDNARFYDVYCNEKRIYTENARTDEIVYYYDYTSLLNVGDYEFYVRARANGKTADSNVIVVSTKTISGSEKGTIVNTLVQTTENDFYDVEIDGTNFIFTPKENNIYVLYLYSESTSLRYFSAEGDRRGEKISINLLSDKFGLKDEIYAIRLGVLENGVYKLASEIVYFNPDTEREFTENIYLFDGQINDFYIESITELRNLIYYSFIYRIDQFDVQLSSKFKNIVNCVAGSSFGDKFVNLIVSSFNYFYETREAYLIECTTMRFLDTNENFYRITIDYTRSDLLNGSNLPECDTSLLPPANTTLKNVDFDGYYDYCDEILRADDPKYSINPYDDFESDQQFLYTVVSSSEELYWAVENKITPIVVPNSRADLIYTKAKQVLREIISDDMTDSEKALSIFDWICANTLYDYYATEDKAYNNKAGTLIPSFYLEGVFVTGYAVCDGFSKAYSLLCNMEGIDCIRIVGTVNTSGVVGGHAWNKVYIDDNPLDSIAGQYYLVDITWTSIATKEEEELSSHAYFLISDNDVKSTHNQFSERKKFNNYKAPNKYDFYENFEFDYKGSTYNLVIDDVADIKPSLLYMLSTGRRTFELIFDFDFLKENYITLNPNSSFIDLLNINKLWSALLDTIKEEKFGQQYLSLVVGNDGELYKYNDENKSGLLMVFGQNLLIDEQEDIEPLLTFIKENSVMHTFKLFVKTDMLTNGDTNLQKLHNLLNTSEIEYTAEFLDTETDAEKGDLSVFKISF